MDPVSSYCCEMEQKWLDEQQNGCGWKYFAISFMLYIFADSSLARICGYVIQNSENKEQRSLIDMSPRYLTPFHLLKWYGYYVLLCYVIYLSEHIWATWYRAINLQVCIELYELCFLWWPVDLFHGDLDHVSSVTNFVAQQKMKHLKLVGKTSHNQPKASRGPVGSRIFFWRTQYFWFWWIEESLSKSPKSHGLYGFIYIYIWCNQIKTHHLEQIWPIQVWVKSSDHCFCFLALGKVSNLNELYFPVWSGSTTKVWLRYGSIFCWPLKFRNFILFWKII